MKNFKVGDKVKHISGNYIEIGNTGIIREIGSSNDYNTGVEWDNKILGHNLNGSIKNNQGYYVQASSLKLIESMNNFININGTKINISDETAEELQKQFSPKKGLWKPEEEEMYYFIHNNGEINTNHWENDKVDDDCFAIGNCFRIEEEAEQEAAKRKVIQSIKIYISENFGVFEPDWGNEEQRKWNVYFDYAEIESKVDWNKTIQNYSPFGYLKSEEDCEQLIKDMEAELKLVFGL